jgi:hypothetical protein
MLGLDAAGITQSIRTRFPNLAEVASATPTLKSVA